MIKNADFRIRQDFNSLDHLKKNVKAPPHPSLTGAMSPFVPPGPVSTPPHPLPPNWILTYQHASQRRAPALDVITEVDESTPTSRSVHLANGVGESRLLDLGCLLNYVSFWMVV